MKEKRYIDYWLKLYIVKYLINKYRIFIELKKSNGKKKYA